MGLDWAEQLSVGNAMIDAEHKNLIIVVNSVEQAIEARDAAALTSALELLDTYVKIHFKNEEHFAEALNMPFKDNMQGHQYLLEEMKIMKKELESMKGRWPEDMVKKYSYYLSDWMANHIVQEDMQMKPLLKAYPYNFKPD